MSRKGLSSCRGRIHHIRAQGIASSNSFASKTLTHAISKKPCYITPEDKVAAEGYAVVQAALKKETRLGLGQIAIANGREYLVAVGPVENGLIMYVLHYADELRKAEVYFC
jgi:non-homologous end joining protein Ku